MKKLCLSFLVCLYSLTLLAQTNHAYQTGEWFKFRIHYGWFNASSATLQVNDEMLDGKEVYHVVGQGKSTGLLDLFFTVNDNYETFIVKETELPQKFIRNIDEGGHTKNKVIIFNQQAQEATVRDRKHNETEKFTTKPQVQDMLSVFYFLRNKIDREQLKKGDQILVNMFFDDKNYKFKTVFLGHERVKSKFGKIKCLKFRPYVQAGRVFKEEESLTFWVSDDENKVPVKIKADLAVGSLEADLSAFKGLKHPSVLKMRK